MGWDRKERGPQSGYFYHSRRIDGVVKKVYLGRGAAGQTLAEQVEQARRQRQAARDAVRAEADATAEADRLAAELHEWARVLTAGWLTATGHRYHRGEWRLRRETCTGGGGGRRA